MHLQRVCWESVDWIDLAHGIDGDDDNNNIYLLQLDCNPVAVVVLHVYKT